MLIVEKLVRPLGVNAERSAYLSKLLPRFVRSYAEQLICPLDQHVTVMKMTMDRTLDDCAIFDVNKIRYFPWTMMCIRFVSIDPAEALTYGPFCAANFDMVAIR